MHDLETDERTVALGRIRVELVGLRLAGRGINRVIKPNQLGAQLVAGTAEIWTFVPPSSDTQLPSGEAAKATFGKRKSPLAAKIANFMSTSIHLTHAQNHETQAKRG